MGHPVYHDPRWRKLRAQHLRKQPRCVICRRPAVSGQALHVDHIVPWRKDYSRRFDPTNVQTLCVKCHATHKRAIGIHGYSNDIGLNGWPIDPRHPVLK